MRVDVGTRSHFVRLRASRTRLWVAALTFALIAAGYRPRRLSGERFPEDHFSGDHSSADLKAREQYRVSGGHSGEHGRGRLADAPSEIPARGWKDILLRVYHNMGEDRVIALAAAVTFYCVLALFPAIAALVALYGLFADPASIASHVDRLSGVLPEGAITVISDEMRRIAAQGNNTLGVTFVIGLAVALWSANVGMKSLFDALNLVYKEREKRSFIKLNAGSLLFTIATLGFVLLAITATVGLPIALNSLGAATDLTARILPWPILLVVLTLGLSCVYRYAPSRDKPKWRWVTWGGTFAAVAWMAASILFSWYAANFGGYNKTYGSLGAMIGFMVWIWISAIVILLGAELNAETEHQSARDTTDPGRWARATHPHLPSDLCRSSTSGAQVTASV
jgi:membrane protein